VNVEHFSEKVTYSILSNPFFMTKYRIALFGHFFGPFTLFMVLFLFDFVGKVGKSKLDQNNLFYFKNITKCTLTSKLYIYEKKKKFI
jgi:hypothetical protein